MSKLTVPMVQIRKAVYAKMAKAESVIAKRPCGFITEITGASGRLIRRMYIEHENVYYSGVMLPWEPVESFINGVFRGVVIEISAVFDPEMEDA